MILVIRFSALGDIAMTVPALYDACLSNPERQFLMLTRKGPANLFVNKPQNLTVLGIDLSEFEGPAGIWRLASRLAGMGVEKVVDLHDVIRSKGIRSFLALRGIPSVHIDKGRGDKHRLTRSRNKRVRQLTPGIERYRETFRKAGLKMESHFKSLFPQDPDPALYAAATPPRRNGEHWIALAPFARHKGKIYPTELMEQVLDELDKRPDTKLFLFAGGPEEEAVAARWAEKYKSIVNLAGMRLGFHGEMALMNQCEVMLSMDSANMHLASLAGTRVVSIWGATHPFCGFLGWNQKEEDTIQLDISCRPCSVFGNKPCLRGDYLCLSGIKPKSILKRLPPLILILASLFPASTMMGAGPSRWSGAFNPSFPPHPDMPGPKSVSPRFLLRTDPQAADADLWRMQLADSKYFDALYSEAIPLYAEVNPKRLPLDVRPQYYLRYAFSLARRGYIAEANSLVKPLRKLKGAEGEADFLEGYLAYRMRDFQTAKALLSQSPAYLFPAPYLGQIEYLDGNFNEAAEILLPFLQKDGRKDGPAAAIRPEALSAAGLSLFKSGDYNQARPILEEAFSYPGFYPSADVIYALGDMAFRDGDSAKASEYMNMIAAEDVAVAQGANYILGQIAAAEGNDQQAALAFSNASRQNIDPSVAERGLYNYIVASSRGANVPFSSPAEIYELYMARFSSGSHDESLALHFAQQYFKEGNFSRALVMIDRVKENSPEILADRQKILYELGRREVISGEYESAERHLRRGASIDSSDSRLTGETLLWLGDALYFQGNYNSASAAYAKALPLLSGENRTLAIYNDAYALFSMEQFAKASARFRQALAASPSLDSQRREDASLRIADCAFYTRNYAKALDGYAEAAREGGQNADYAAMREAVANGLLGNVQRKISILENFSSSYPSSRWKADVLLELGNTYASQDRPDEANTTFNRLSREFPASTQARRGTLANAVALARSGRDDAAMEAYRDVISRWPSSEEAELANNDLRRLAAKNGEIREYAEFLRSVPGAPSIDENQIEQLAFEAAESAYADNIEDISRLERYIKDYPDGRYLANALIDLAESKRAAGDPAGAVAMADKILSYRPDSPQSIEALLLKGEVIESELPSRMAEAAEAYRKLERAGGAEFAPEAYAGIMRTTSDPEERLAYARKVRATGNQDPSTLAEAEFYEAAAMVELPSSSADGLKGLLRLARDPETLPGARAAVTAGEFLIKSKRYDEALKLLADFTDHGSPHAYWLARGFILLSDVYRAKGEKSLADEYLRSLRSNYPGDEEDIRQAISSRLSK